ncbi:MAG: protein kinase [Deltaproteobacteria bacterium]|nr:protein kinase [Deltaproteobacteria bacterium]
MSFFGSYQVIGDIGAGGVARVLRARHVHPGYAEAMVALKLMHPQLAQDPAVRSLFANEAYLLSLLRHRNIVRTYEAGAEEGQLFIAMEYIDGRDLRALLSRWRALGAPFPIPVALHIAHEVLSALEFAHELHDHDGRPLGIIHQDINPSNVFVSFDGEVKLGDFGVAALAAEQKKDGAIAGKVGYFAPEQLEGKQADQRADLFAFGLTLYEILCGKHPFDAKTAGEVMELNRRDKVLRPAKLNPAITPDVEALLTKALERKPKHRYQSARDMRAVLAPLVLEPAGMRLAVRAMMRTLFLAEHMQELLVRQGLAGGHLPSPDGGVAVYSDEPRLREDISRLLAARGFLVYPCAGWGDLRAAVAAGDATVAYVDLLSHGVSRGELSVALKDARRSVPIVAMVPGLDAEAIRVAHAIGAVDIVIGKIDVERIHAAIYLALTTASKRQHAVAAAGEPGTLKLLMVTREAPLAQAYAQPLAQRGYQVDAVTVLEQAVQRLNETTFHALLYDVIGATVDHPTAVMRLRAAPGIGLLPVIFLADAGQQAGTAGLEQTAVRPRHDDPAALATTIDALRAQGRKGRSFVRYEVSLAVELRYQGRAFAGHAVNLSRGGVLLRCDEMTPVGAPVNVGFPITAGNERVEVQGEVLRVDRPSPQTGGRPELGVEFRRFAGASEPLLIAYLAGLGPSAG